MGAAHSALFCIREESICSQIVLAGWMYVYWKQSSVDINAEVHRNFEAMVER